MVLPNQPRAKPPDEQQEADRRRVQRERNQAAIDVLDRLIDASDDEIQDRREALEALASLLNEDRAPTVGQPVHPFAGHPTAWSDGLTEEEILAEQAKRLDALVETLTNVSDEEAREQDETWEYLRRVLNEDRLSYRRRVP
ncbi:MAG TPA: hypothetical protein VMP03_07495 [Methylomirabilota bacterium]|nr:hypothetical protein [Methylomirabilota bacterium]